MADFLKNAGLKTTVQRCRILAAFKNSINKHISAEDLYKLLKSNSQSVSLATIYRVLAQFEIAGIIIKHKFEDNHAVFELSEHEYHHDHLICTKCQAIIEFFDEIIEGRQLAIANQYDFKISSHSLSISGICSKCK